MKKWLFCSIFATVFFISFSFPQYNYASSSSSSDKASVDSQLPDMGYEGLLLFSVQRIAPIVLKMSQALGRLHTEYPGYFKLWHQLLVNVPETDRRGSQTNKVLNEAEVIFSTLATYSQAYQSEIIKAEGKVAKGTAIDREALAFQQADIETLLGILERLCQYEAFSHDLLADLHHIGLGVLSDYVAPSSLKKLNDFESLRKKQLSSYFKERLIYQNSIQALSALGSLYNNDTRELLQGQARHYIDLSENIAARKNVLGNQATKRLLQEVKRLAKAEARGFLAMDATFTEGDDGRPWSVLFVPPSRDKTPVSTPVLDQRRMARHLIGALDAMRPSLQSLVSILLERNKVFFQDAFIEKEDLRQLRESLALETVRLLRFRSMNKEIDAADISLDTVTESDRIASLYSEIGYLKEDILSFEVSILQELHFLNDSEMVNSHPDWQRIQGFIEKQYQWGKSWSGHAANWKKSVQLFRKYQVSAIKRYTAALQTISTEIQKARQQLQSDSNPKTAKFIHFFDRWILELLTETQGMLLKKQEMVNREEKDPVFASLFGVNSERFWHDFRGQGIGFWRLEKLIQSKKEIISHIRALSSDDVNDVKWPLRMINIADALNMVQDIAIIDDEVAVVFGNGADALILKGLFKQNMPTLEIASAELHIRSNANLIFSTLSTIFSPRQAHAGFLSGIKKWGGAVYNQAGKNWVNYAVIGAIAAGSLLAGPAAPAVLAVATASFNAQVTADTAIATAQTVGDALVSDPKVRKTMHSRIKTLETIYNVAQIVESAGQLWKGTSGVNEIAEQAGKFSERISSTLDDMLAKQGDLIKRMARVKDYLLKTNRSSKTMKRGMQILSDLATEAVARGDDIAAVTSRLGEQVKKFTTMAQTGGKGSNIGSILANLQGILSGYDDKKPSNKPETDSDGDGTPDKKDGCATDPKKIAPGVCGCGTLDTDKDGDGTPDCNDDCPDDANKTDPGVCGCGTKDADSDRDGTPDCNDRCPNDADKTDPGECGCGIPDDDSNVNGVADCKETKDSDGDTIPDIHDKCPKDPNKIDPGECGCGVPDDDSNVNGIADCKEAPKNGCTSDNNCPQGYVCNVKSGHCVDPFDENYDSRNQLMASNEQDRQRANDSQNIADANLDPNDGKFTSSGLADDIDKTQDFVSAECNDRKPCPAGHICKDGHCIDEHNDCNSSDDCPRDQICKSGKCIAESGSKPKSLVISPANKAVKIHEPVTLKAMLKMADGSAKDVTQETTWSPGNPFSKGSIGQYTVKATYKNVSGTAMITVVKEKGMDDITVNSKKITVTFFDHGRQDGDMIDILINGKPVFSGITLTKAPQSRTITMNSDVIVFGFRALNEGKIPPNTATVTFTSVVKGKSTQKYELKKNQKTNMNISYSPKP